MSIGEILLRSRYQPLKRVLSYDVFNTGFNGWMTLMPNFTEYPDFDVPKTLVNKDQWPPVMLSSATFRYPGTHGAMSGTYSLKLSTRPVAAPYDGDSGGRLSGTCHLSGFRSLVRAANICR